MCAHCLRSGLNRTHLFSGLQLIAFGLAPQLRTAVPVGGLKGETATVRALGITIFALTVSWEKGSA
jgi:hypothetical protein